MKFFIFCNIAAFHLLVCANANFLTNAEPKEGTLHLGFSQKRAYKHSLPKAYKDRLQKRAPGLLDSPLENRLEYYNIEVELGTPKQQFNLLIDTGSSDMWVPDAANPNCTPLDPSRDTCTKSGSFNTTASSTFHSTDKDFYIKYADGAEAEGSWVTDTLNIHNHTVENMIFGLNSNTPEPLGVLGIGYDLHRVNNGTYLSDAFANLPVRLVRDKIINSPAYSLWLNDVDDDEGSLLFGGVDHSKYSGILTKVPVLKNSTEDKYHHLIVGMSSLKFNSNGKTQEMLDTNYAVLLDSGSAFSYFPRNVADKIFQSLNASFEPNINRYITSCDVTGSVNVDFLGANLSISYNQILRSLTIDDTKPVLLDNGEDACIIGIVPGAFPFAIMGATFLRSAYVVYDLQNNEIALAQSVFNTTESDIEVISSTIPGAIKASAYSSTSWYDETTTSTDTPTLSTVSFPVISLDLNETSSHSSGKPTKSSTSHSSISATAGSTSATTTLVSAASPVSVFLGPYCLSSSVLLIGPMLAMIIVTLIIG